MKEQCLDFMHSKDKEFPARVKRAFRQLWAAQYKPVAGLEPRSSHNDTTSQEADSDLSHH
jgi:hypothetical protein